MNDHQNAKANRFTPQQALSKAENYCAYQERSQQEVRDKLYSWGLATPDVEAIISDLINTNFLNEERFALAYAAGKFRMKQWGMHKIKLGLKQKSVSAPLIKIALNSIPSAEYEQQLLNLLEKKSTSLNESDPYRRKHKLAQYALGKGYESELIFDLLNNTRL